MKVAIVAIARLENDYINEWIGHHLKIGVNHIYIYDNSSYEEEKLSGIVYSKFLNRVTIIPAYNKTQYQMLAYKDAYYKYGVNYDYLIYIDIDEFIMLQKDSNIKEFISRFPNDCECYRMNWEIYGDNGIINRDTSRSIVGDFTKPVKTNRNNTTKSIVKCGLEHIDFISVHYPIRDNGKQSNLKTYFGNMKDITNELPIDKKSLNIGKCDYSLVKLNHYITKSLGEFICQKMRRPDAAWNYERDIDNDFFRYNEKTPEKVKFYEDSQNILKYYYWSPKKSKGFENAGDYYNKILMNKLYHCVCTPSTTYVSNLNIAFCGSILASKNISNAEYIVGCGLQNKKNPTNKNVSAYKAIRGRLTQQRLRNNDIDIDNVVFADPGLLVSKIYSFKYIKKKYHIGIIPHYVDEDDIRDRYKDYHIISMRTTDVQMVCREIMECDIIISSSLHGIIFSHSLGVPAYHIELNSLQDGDNFKFKDYYTSYDRNIEYKVFKCNGYNIPFDDIYKFDKMNRGKCNPTSNEVISKQNELLNVLPYKKYLNIKYIKGKMDDENIEVKNVVEVEIPKPKQDTTRTKISKLQSDITNGRIVKVVSPDGLRFIWKRVK